MSENLIIRDKSHLPREAKKKLDTSFDRIWKFYFKNNVRIELTKKEEQLRERWEHVWSLLGKILTTRQVIKKHSFKYSIDLSTAYEDMHNAKKLFGDSQDQMKKAQRAIVSVWLEKAIKKAYKADEWKSMEKLILRYTRINGLDLNEGDGIADLIKKMKPHTIIITGDPRSLKQEADELMEGVEQDQDIGFEFMDQDD